MATNQQKESVNKKPLDYYFNLTKRTVLDFQNAVTGLFPACLFRGQHATDKECSDAWIRDNVYTILSVWGLTQAYQKSADLDEDKSKQYELEQSVVKLMRGLLKCMMQQVGKVEAFKKSQRLLDSIHAKYSTGTGKTVVSDEKWGHLQIDAVALYLVILGQMTVSGLQIIYTKDEVDFIQSLVFYIENAYRVPDFGIWERGDKANRGMTELNASSVGMAKAALEVMNELDVFGSRGGAGSVIHVQGDQIQYCKTVLHSMLPRESNSKEISASLLSVISFPAFAVEDANVIDLTRRDIISKLQGTYGCKRFLRDGHNCENEDRLRLHYELHELSKFENIECEWPLFFLFLILDGLYNNNDEQVRKYVGLLEPLLVPTESGVVLVPELFYVPLDKIEAERLHPHSQARLCGNHLPHLWSQSLYILCMLLQEGFIAVGELDPLNRRYVTATKPEVVIQVALIAEDESIKALLSEHGIQSQTSAEASPVRILPARCLSRIYCNMGVNDKLGLSGRPRSGIGVIGISSLYRVAGNILAFAPQFLDYRQFYMCLDNDLLVDSFKTEVEYLRNNCRMLGRPTITLPITHALLEDTMQSTMGKFIMQVSSGYLYSVRIRVGIMSDFISRGSIKHLDFVDGNHLEDLIGLFPDPTISPRLGKVLKHSVKPRMSLSRSSFGSDENLTKSTVIGSVSRSRSISRAASWGASSGSDDESVGTSEVVRGFLLDGMDMKVPVITIDDDVDIDEIRSQLEQAADITEQADIIHYLYTTRGYNYDVRLYGIEGCTVLKLISDLYEKACHLKLWSLVRHTAGMLRKTVENLDQVCTELLVNQKQLGIGLPHMNREEIIAQPLPPAELKRFIYRLCGEDSSTAVLTQELLTYLAMFVKTDPDLFSEMLQIRVGLIMEILAAEYARVSGLSGEDAADHLMNVSPFLMKNLLYYILSGKEFGFDQDSGNAIIVGNESSCNIREVKKVVKKVSVVMQREKSGYFGSSPSDSVFHSSQSLGTKKIGQWLRRRCLDGALNRVPPQFYSRMWFVLKRCNGMVLPICGINLEHRLTLENTPQETKFALKIEEELNKISYPEYRQLVVESMMILSLLLDRDPNYRFNNIISLDQIIADANKLFLENQRLENGDATLCCATRLLHNSEDDAMTCGATNGICRYFYDSAPSGSYGTMTYITQSVLTTLYSELIESNMTYRLN